MNSTSIHTSLLYVEPLDIPTPYIIPVFLFGAFTYCSIMFFNIILLLTIALNHKLHKPMYILLFNMPINDMIGVTAFLPKLLYNIVSQNRSITYTACFVQAFFVHLYACGTLLILTVMAYDRYAAICLPLKYNIIMSPNTLVRIIISIWCTTFGVNSTLLALNYRQEICSTNIVDNFCNNPSLMKLICGDKRAGNYYGLSITALYQVITVFAITFTYIQILYACVSKTQSNAKSKAIQTCGTHLVVFLGVELSSLFFIISHRFENGYGNLRGISAAAAMVFPPFLNPLVYGLKTKEIQQNIFFFFHRKILPS